MEFWPKLPKKEKKMSRLGHEWLLKQRFSGVFPVSKAKSSVCLAIPRFKDCLGSTIPDWFVKVTEDKSSYFFYSFADRFTFVFRVPQFCFLFWLSNSGYERKSGQTTTFFSSTLCRASAFLSLESGNLHKENPKQH